MKTYLLKSLLLILTISFISCSDDEDLTQATECPDAALYTIDKANGKMVYLGCYDAWGIELDEPLENEERTIGASLEIRKEYEVDGLRVQVDACFYEFDLPLVIADPAPWGQLYRMDNIRMVGE